MTWCLHRCINLAPSVHPVPLDLRVPALHIAPVLRHRCIRALPDRPVLGHRFNWCYCFLQNSSNSAFLWVLSSCFALLGLFASSLGSINVHLTNSLVPLIVLLFNHQNHKQWPNGAIFLTRAIWLGNFSWLDFLLQIFLENRMVAFKPFTELFNLLSGRSLCFVAMWQLFCRGSRGRFVGSYHDTFVGFYRQICLGIPLAVGL